MDHQEYVAARRTRLVEHAVELGVAEDEAEALVDRVLDRQRRTIARAEDPDPELRGAVREAALGPPTRSRASPFTATAITATAFMLLLALVAFGVIRYLALDPAPTPRVPMTYSLQVDAASDELSDAGYEVATRDVEVCESAGQVIGTEPAPSSKADEGSTVIVLVARPPGLGCLPGAGFRAMVWEFLRWVAGLGPAPPLGQTPTITVIDDSGDRTTRLPAAELDQRVGDADLLGPLRDAVTQVAPTPSGFPELTVRNGFTTPPCGGSAPVGYDSILAVRFDLDTTADGTDPCPLTGYLLSDGDLIETVVLLVPAN